MSLFFELRFVALLPSARAWLARFFKILFHSTIFTMWVVEIFIQNSFFYCSSSVSGSIIYRSLCSELELEGVYWVYDKRKRNGLKGSKRVRFSCGTPYFYIITRPPLSSSLLGYSWYKLGSFIASLWHSDVLNVESICKVHRKDKFNGKVFCADIFALFILKMQIDFCRYLRKSFLCFNCNYSFILICKTYRHGLHLRILL